MCYSNTQITTRKYYTVNQVNSRSLISLPNVQDTALINSNSKLPLVVVTSQHNYEIRK